MSADEFDPRIERLFARTPPMADAPLFAAEVEARLTAGSRIRALALTVAGLVGGVFAVRETMQVNFHLAPGNPLSDHAINSGLGAMTTRAQQAIQSGLADTGLSGLGLGSTSGMQMFWLTAGVLIALAAAGAMKFSQDI